MGTALGSLLLAAAVAVTASTCVPSARRLPALLATLGSWAALGYAAAVLLLLAARVAGRRRADAVRRWTVIGSVLALAGLLLHLAWLAPRYAGGDRTAAADLTVMTANLQYGKADADTVVDAVRGRGVDVLVAEEVTPEELTRLGEVGLQRMLPRSEGTPSETSVGTMVFSRYRLTPAVPVPLSQGGLGVSVAAPRPFTLLAAHGSDPLFRTSRWAHDLAVLGDVAARAARSGPVLVAGDLNTTPDHPAFRRVLRSADLRDAAEQAGSGLAPTWPAKRGLTPLLTIDHVLTGPAYAAVRTHRVVLPGSDHRGLVADLVRTEP